MDSSPAARYFHTSPADAIIIRYLYYGNITAVMGIVIKTNPVPEYPSSVAQNLYLLSAERAFPGKHDFRLSPCLSIIFRYFPSYFCGILKVEFRIRPGRTRYLRGRQQPDFFFRRQEKRWVLFRAFSIVLDLERNDPLTLSGFET